MIVTIGMNVGWLSTIRPGIFHVNIMYNSSVFSFFFFFTFKYLMEWEMREKMVRNL